MLFLTNDLLSKALPTQQIFKDVSSMTRVLKEDYFTGVFSSFVFRSSSDGFILSEPLAKAKRRIRFTADPGVNYNVYLK
jgi:hypothetical protein